MSTSSNIPIPTPMQPTEAELKNKAQKWHESGVSVIPTQINWNDKKQRYDKKFLCNSWSQWQTLPQTDAEFKILNWKNANGITVILGSKAKNGFYLSVIDYDVKGEISKEVKQKGQMVFSEFPETYIEQTVNHGKHLFYYSRKQPKTISIHHDKTGIELLGDKKLCVMYPSFGYTKLNNINIAEVENIEQLYLNIMKKHGIAKEQIPQKTQQQLQQQTQKTSMTKMPRLCMKEALHYQLTGPKGHKMRLGIAAEYKLYNYTDDEIVNFFKNQPDFDEKKCREQIKSADPTKTFTCKTIKELGYCQPNCSCNKKTNDTQNDQIIYFRPTIVTEDFIAEMIWSRKETEQPVYMKYYFQEDRFEEVQSISLGEVDDNGRSIVYVPPFNESLKKGLVIVPSGIIPTSFADVFKEVDKFVKLCYDACGQDDLVKLLTWICIGSWFLDRFVTNLLLNIAGSGKFVPLIPIRGPSQSGKNRLAFVLRILSYRPYFEMSTSRIPSLYRPMDLWKGTLVLDEADFAQTNERSELIHYLNCRATGTPVSRQSSKDPSVTDTFDNFGLTILTQRRGFDDNATESRAIPFYSERSEKKISVAEPDEALQLGLELQNKLLYLRLKWYREIKIEKDTWIEDVSDSRLMASLLPLCAIAKFEPTIKEAISCSVREIESAKIREKANSLDGQLIFYLWEKINEGLFVCHCPGVYYVLENFAEYDVDEFGEKKQTVLTANVLANHFGRSAISIGKALTSLGIASKKLNNSVKVGKKTFRVIFFEPSMIEKRLKEFVADYQLNQIFSLVAGDTEVTDSQRGEPKKTLTDYSNTDSSQSKTKTNNERASKKAVHSSVDDERIPYYFYLISAGKKCPQCENFAAQYVITHKNKKEKLCDVCFKRRQQRFTNAHWIQLSKK